MSRTAPYGNVLEIADTALVSSNGIVVETSSPRIADNLRMRFYAKRNELQKRGENKYDCLTLTKTGTSIKFDKIEDEPVKVTEL